MYEICKLRLQNLINAAILENISKYVCVTSERCLFLEKKVYYLYCFFFLYCSFLFFVFFTKFRDLWAAPGLLWHWGTHIAQPHTLWFPTQRIKWEMDKEYIRFSSARPEGWAPDFCRDRESSTVHLRRPGAAIQYIFEYTADRKYRGIAFSYKYDL